MRRRKPSNRECTLAHLAHSLGVEGVYPVHPGARKMALNYNPGGVRCCRAHFSGGGLKRGLPLNCETNSTLTRTASMGTILGTGSSLIQFIIMLWFVATPKRS